MESNINPINDLFKHTLVINLDHRTDRLEHVTKEFEKMDIQFERFPAIKPANNAVGCSMSHIRCLEIAIERDYPQVFICEDDITFLNPELFKSNLNKFLTSHNGKCAYHWDVLIVGGNNAPPFHQVKEYCARVFRCQTTTGYVVQRHFYKALLDNFRSGLNFLIKNPNNRYEYAIDKFWIRLQTGYLWFMITPPTVIQYDNYSDIERKNTRYSHVMLDFEKKWFKEGRTVEGTIPMNIT